MPFINDEVFDQGLDYADTNGTRIDICSSDPGGTYSNVTSSTLGNDTVNTGATQDGAVDGRRVIVPAITAGTVTATGTAAYWALTDAASIVVASGPLDASQAVTSGNTFSLDPISVTIRDATDVADTVTLSGTTGSPNTATGFAVTPTNSTAGWLFNSDGTVDKQVEGTYTQFASGTEWVIPNEPSINYYIRATNYANSNPTSGTLGSWLSLTANREWSWTRTIIGTDEGTLKIEIATDASGVNIVATGYYRGFVEVDSGA